MQHWKEWGLKFANQTLKVKGRLMDQPTLYFGNNYKEQINRGGNSFITFIFLISLIFYPKPNGTLGFDKKIWN